VSREALTPKQWHHLCVTYAGGANPEAVGVYIDGAAKEIDVQANTLKSTIRTRVPFKIGQRHSTAGVDGAGSQDGPPYGRALSPEEVERLARGTRGAWLASRGAADLSPAEKDELFARWLPGEDEPYRALTRKLAALEGEDRAIRLRGTVAHVMHERSEAAS